MEANLSRIQEKEARGGEKEKRITRVARKSSQIVGGVEERLATKNKGNREDGEIGLGVESERSRTN